MSIKDYFKEEKKFDIGPDDYRLMFESSHGQKVLAHMLMEYHFCEEVETPEETTERNVLIRILNRAGILKEDNLKLIAKNLIEIGRLSKKTEV